MKKLFILMAIVGFAATPAVAHECPALQAQIDTAFGNRFDGTGATSRMLAREAWALHETGKHAESVAKYAESAKAGNLELKHMK